MSICSLCIHIDACRAWVRHGKALYEDFEYSTDNCPQFTNDYNIVEVVRCKDCKWYKESKLLAPIRFCYRLRGINGEPVGYNFSDNDFCSYGERRTT